MSASPHSFSTHAVVRERPILFSALMVRAILDDRKTQTRRVVKNAPTDADGVEGQVAAATCIDAPPGTHFWRFSVPASMTAGYRCPYGQPGDRLWVREAWRVMGLLADTPTGDLNPTYREHLQFKADADETYIAGDYRPSIFMPRWASRILLELTGVRVERLQHITADDAIAEGIRPVTEVVDGAERMLWGTGPNAVWLADDAISAYLHLWEDINNPRGYCADDNAACWEANPWVWALTFKRLRPLHRTAHEDRRQRVSNRLDQSFPIVRAVANAAVGQR